MSIDTQRGFTLIEIVMSLALVLSAIVIFSVALSGASLTTSTRMQNVAYHAAAKKMEEFRNTSFSSLPPSGAFTDSALSSLPSSTASFVISAYQGSSEIKDVSITVQWMERGIFKNVNLHTLMSQNGLNP